MFPSFILPRRPLPVKARCRHPRAVSSSGFLNPSAKCLGECPGWFLARACRSGRLAGVACGSTHDLLSTTDRQGETHVAA